MAISEVGTPEALGGGAGTNRTTSSPVTGIWNGTQTLAKGDLLVAAVSAVGSTSVTATAQNTGTTGWTKQFEVFNTTGAGTKQVAVSIWTKVATGGDAAPAFTSTLGGTAAMACVLYELNGANTVSLVDTSGTESSSGSGTGSAAIGSTAVTSAADVNNSGEFAIMIAARERATNTYTITGSASWTLDVNDGSTNSVAHTGVQSYSNPPGAAALAGTISYSGTNTTAFGAGLTVVFNASNPKMSALADTLTEGYLNSAPWSLFTGGGATASHAINGVTISLPAASTSSTDGSVYSNNLYDLTNSAAYLQVTQVLNAATNANATLLLDNGGNVNSLTWIYQAGTLYAEYSGTQVFSVAYSAALHAWWRIRESGGTVYWDTAPDGASWVNQASVADPFNMTAFQVNFEADCYENETSPGSFTFLNFNTVPPSGAISQAVRARPASRVYVLGNPGLIYVTSRDGTP